MLVEKAEPLRKPGRPAKGEGENVSNGNINGGNNHDYLVARLKRDAPEIAEGLKTGKYPRVRQGAG